MATIRRFLSYKHCDILIHAFVTSRIDYCNSLLSGLPQFLLLKVQYVQNAAASLLTHSNKYDHISPILKDQHWLPIKSRIEFKILILTFKAYHEIGPKYLSDSLIKYTLRRTLRSANKNLLVNPMYNLESYGKRAFSVIAPLLWNNLPDEIRTTTCLSSFKRRVKTFFLAVFLDYDVISSYVSNLVGRYWLIIRNGAIEILIIIIITGMYSL